MNDLYLIDIDYLKLLFIKYIYKFLIKIIYFFMFFYLLIIINKYEFLKQYIKSITGFLLTFKHKKKIKFRLYLFTFIDPIKINNIY